MGSRMPGRDSIPPAWNEGLVDGRFEVEGLIGHGGMGEVFAAKHALTGKRVALKRIRSEGRAAGGTDRFLREAHVVSALHHPNIVEIYDAFEDEDGAAVLVMELLVGETLSAYRARADRIGLGEASAILVPVARALLHAHRLGVVHRDLKPENIFLVAREGGAPVSKVLDFGIAKVLGSTELATGLVGESTRTGAIVGTPHYMAFEQAMSERDVDCRADIWSLGVILFEALAGRRPIAFETFGQMYTAFLKGTVLSARETLPDLPGEVAEILDRCLAIDRSARLEGLEPFIETLAPYEGATAGDDRVRVTAARAIPVRSPRRHVGAAALVIALTAGVGVTAIAVTHRAVHEPTAGTVELPAEVGTSAVSDGTDGAGPGRNDTPAATGAPGPPGPPVAASRSAAAASRSAPGPSARASKTAVSSMVVPVPHEEVSAGAAVKKGILATPPY
jgi:hypothetical protein